MGRTITPKYRLEYYDNHKQPYPHKQTWDVKTKGKTTDQNLEKYLIDFGKSFEVGRVNDHISKSIGYIPYPQKGRIINQRTNEIVAIWKAPMFMVW
jgi:hypothetical protein